MFLNDPAFHVPYAEKLNVIMGGHPFFLGMNDTQQYRDDTAAIGRQSDISGRLVDEDADDLARNHVQAGDVAPGHDHQPLLRILVVCLGLGRTCRLDEQSHSAELVEGKEPGPGRSLHREGSVQLELVDVGLGDQLGRDVLIQVQGQVGRFDCVRNQTSGDSVEQCLAQGNVQRSRDEVIGFRYANLLGGLVKVAAGCHQLLYRLSRPGGSGSRIRRHLLVQKAR